MNFVRIVSFIVATFMATNLHAQTGNLQAGQIWGNPAASAKPATGTTVGAILDQSYSCNARGDIIFRGSSAWSCLAPGTSGLPLVSQGAGADLHYAQIGNSALVNPATTVNGQTCTLGSTCTITASAGTITSGTTTVAGSTNLYVLYNNAGTLGSYPVTGSGNVVMSASPTFSGIPILNTPTATSLALGGATIGSNALAVTGTSQFNGNINLNSINLTGTYTVGGTPSIAGSAINSGTVSGSYLSAANLASSANGGVTGVLPTANGGTGSSVVQTARGSANLNIDEATSTGDANYTILPADRMVYHTALSAARTDTLPAANAVNAGQVFYLTDFPGVVTASHTVTLQRAGADTINGVTSVVALNAQYAAAVFWSDGVSKWTFFPASAGGGSGTVTNVTLSAGSGVTLSGTCTITVSGTCTVSGAVPTPQGRLTLATNTPVMSPTSCGGSPCSAQTTLRYDCYNGGSVPYYNGSNDLLDTITSCEVTAAMVSAASAGQVVGSQVYDVWWVHGGANRICVGMSNVSGGGGGWAFDTGGSNTARGTGFSQLDTVTRPYVTNKNTVTNCFNGSSNYGPISANQGTYLGTVWASGNGQISYVFGGAASGGSAGLLGVWNAYNRVPVTSSVIDTGIAYAYTSATIRQARASTNYQTQFVSGMADSAIEAHYSYRINAIIGSGNNGQVGVGLDTVSTFTCDPAIVYNPSASTGFVNGGTITCDIQPQIGFHTVSANEQSDGSANNNFNFNSLSTLMLNVRM